METNHHCFHHHHHRHSFFLFLLLLITTTTAQTPSLSLSPSPSPLPLSSSSPQLNNIIDALIGAGDFSIWVNILSMSNPTLLPVSATLFIPQDTTLPNNSNNKHNGIPMVDPFLFPYHVVPQRLTFSDLLLFRRNSRLPTLLPGKSLSVTDISAGNISLDGAPITHPDIYSTPNVAVHGVAAVLDYSLFGEGVPPPPPAPKNALPPPFVPIGDAIEVAWRSGAPAAGYDCLWCTSVNVAFLAFVLFLQELVFLTQ